MGKYVINSLIIALVTALLVTGCSGASSSASMPGSPAAPKRAVQEISVEEAMKLWQAQHALLIDVRTPEEYSQGHIKGAVLIPLNELEKRAGEVAKDKRVLIICRSGSRSASANLLLQDLGFTNTVSIKGGMSVWPGDIVK